MLTTFRLTTCLLSLHTVVECGPLTSIEHGQLTLVDNRTTYAARAEYECDANYTLVGEKLRTCSDGGAWSDAAPQCLCECTTGGAEGVMREAKRVKKGNGKSKREKGLVDYVDDIDDGIMQSPASHQCRL